MILTMIFKPLNEGYQAYIQKSENTAKVLYRVSLYVIELSILPSLQQAVKSGREIQLQTDLMFGKCSLSLQGFAQRSALKGLKIPGIYFWKC